MFGDGRIDLRVCEREPSTPFQIGDQSRAELWIARHSGIVRGETHQAGKPKPLLSRNAELSMLLEHSLVASQLCGVFGRASENLTPPRGDVATMLGMDAARKERGQQFVFLDSVVKSIDHALNRLVAARPLK